MHQVLLIDYGLCNLFSVKRAFEECGAYSVFISNDPRDFKNCSHLVLPGVGSYADAMSNIKNLGLYDPIRETVLEDKVPFIGICLGMQLLTSQGTEGGLSKGLNLIPGKTVQIESPTERVPHVGWNEIYYEGSPEILDGVPQGSDFYFVHSYHVVPDDEKDILTKTPYAGGVVSGVKRDNILGFQFHPEKSSRMGFQIIKNFLKY